MHGLDHPGDLVGEQAAVITHQKAACSIEAVQHAALTPPLIAELRTVFDAEYLADSGEWDPELPYGYASHDLHLIARADGEIVGHVGWGRRTISVGSSTGDCRDRRSAGRWKARGMRVGQRMMHAARLSIFGIEGVEFGYLGCREEDVHFYRSCGWQRISAAERSVSLDGRVVEDPPGQPLFVLPVHPSAGDWPEGTIDLRGRPW